MPEIFQLIESAASTLELAFAVCAYSKDTTLGKMNNAKDFVNSPFRWNFANLVQGNKGTIEFRQPPGSRSAAHTHMWIELATSFVQGAVAFGAKINPTVPPTILELRNYVLNGAKLSGIANLGNPELLFAGRQDLPFGPYNLKNVTKDGLDKFIRKAKQANISVEKFKALYNQLNVFIPRILPNEF